MAETNGKNGKEEKNGRERAINLTIAQIEKDFGRGAVMRLGSNEALVAADVIPTGSLGLDAA